MAYQYRTCIEHVTVQLLLGVEYMYKQKLAQKNSAIMDLDSISPILCVWDPKLYAGKLARVSVAKDL